MLKSMNNNDHVNYTQCISENPKNAVVLLNDLLLFPCCFLPGQSLNTRQQQKSLQRSNAATVCR